MEVDAKQREWCRQALDVLKSKTEQEAREDYGNLVRAGAWETVCKEATRVDLGDGILFSANFIRHNTLSSGPTAICAGQPRARFWEIVVEQRCRAIVKLTCNFNEDYFPMSPGEFMKFGRITVTNKKLTHLQHGALRRVLEVDCPGHDVFEVEHFQYSWPDFGVPSSLDPVLEIVRELHKIEPGQSYVVHCWAGIGRSGTLLTIDHILRRILVGDLSAANVFDAVRYLRQQRGGLVETGDQYWFCYRALIKQLKDLIEPNSDRNKLENSLQWTKGSIHGIV